MLEYSIEKQEVVLKLYATKKQEISESLHKLLQKDSLLQDFTWRFETQVSYKYTLFT